MVTATPVLQARGLIKRYGHVTALDGADFDAAKAAAKIAGKAELGDDFVRRLKVVVMDVFRGPGRRLAVVDDQQGAARGDGS